MTHYQTWVAYGGSARIALAVITVAAAGGAAWAAWRLRRPAPLPTVTGWPARGLVAVWVLSIAAVPVGVGLYARQELHDHLTKAGPANPISPVTYLTACGLFVLIAVLAPGTTRVKLTTAAVGAMAAPMVFELPFDLIVMTRSFPPLPPDPALYRAVFFVPLFAVEITTLGLLTLTPLARLTRPALMSLALMFAVFAGWALDGFGYPDATVPVTLNVVSKLLAFCAVLGLFTWRGGLRFRPGRRDERPWAGSLEASQGRGIRGRPAP